MANMMLSRHIYMEYFGQHRMVVSRATHGKLLNHLGMDSGDAEGTSDFVLKVNKDPGEGPPGVSTHSPTNGNKRRTQVDVPWLMVGTLRPSKAKSRALTRGAGVIPGCT